MAMTYTWRGNIDDEELNRLHAEAFDTRVYSANEWSWVELINRHSLGWVVAREGDTLVGFVNVLWDGLVHAWLQDTIVGSGARHRGVGSEVAGLATLEARAAVCEWLHVDFDEHLRSFSLDACGVSPSQAGRIAL